MTTYFMPDEGCEFAPSCLNCHLPVCKEDNYVAVRRAVQQEQARSLRAQGLKVQEIAEVMGKGQKQIFRYLSYA